MAKTGFPERFLRSLTGKVYGPVRYANLFLAGFILTFVSAALKVSAQDEDPAAIDETFETGAGAEGGEVFSLEHAFDADPASARILIGGSFTSYDGNFQRYVALLDGTGSRVPDEEFDPAVIGESFFPPSNVAVAKWDGADRIVIGGFFEDVGGEERDSIARLQADGSLDDTFAAGANDSVFDVTVLDDDSMIVVGEFTEMNGSTVNRIARLNEDGSLDGDFGSSVGFNNDAHVIVPDGDGNFLVGGDFASYRTRAAGRLVRMDADGNFDETFDIGIGFTGGGVREIVVMEDGHILVGGNFTSFNESPANRIVKLDSDGNRVSFSVGAGFNNTVHGIAVDADGRILVAGAFSEASGEARSNLARLLSNGSLDPTFDPADGPDNTVRDLAVQEDARILIAGEFRFYRSQGHRRVARLEGAGEVVEPEGGYESWRNDMFGPDAGDDTISGPDADPDGDGFANVLEYAFQGDPLVPYSATIPSVATVAGNGGDFLEITFQRIAADDLVYRVEASGDLSGWTEIWTSVDHPMAEESRTETVTDTEPIGANLSRFLRVQVTLSE